MTKKLKRYMLSMNFFLIWIMFLEVSNALKEVVKLQSTNSVSSEKPTIEINNNEIQQVIEAIGSSTTTTIPSPPLGPYFVERVNENISISALVDKTAYLSCKVNNLGNKTVSWVRHRDVHLLTVGRYTYTSDDRFRAINGLNSNEWILQIKYPQQRDAGVYECQISTTPHLSRFYQLNVIEPKAKILGGSEMYIDHGSTINITCLIIGGLDPQGFVFWFHNNRIINENSPRGGIQITTELGSKAKSVLLINNARPTDSGRYDCNPTNADYKSIVIHVLKGNYPEAMQHNNSGAQFSTTKFLNYYVIDILFIFFIIKFYILS